MRKKYNIFSIFTAVFIMLSFTAGCQKEESDGRNYSFSYALEQNPQNLDPQLAVDDSSLTIIENMFEGLTTVDENGFLTYGAAESCEISDDCLTYTFKLRNDCYWYDGKNEAFSVKADDFVFAFQRIFNPVTQSPYKKMFSFLKNAREIIDGKLDYTQIGVHSADESTIVFELDKREPCFMEMLASSPAMPCCRSFFDRTDACYGLDEESVISNGSFYIKQWFYDPYGKENFIFMRRNAENYSSRHDIIPYSINFVISGDDEITADFKAGNYDCIISDSDSEYNAILSRTFVSKEYADRTVGIIINNDDDAVSNENFKKALSVSVNRESLNNKLISSYQVAYGMISPCASVGNLFFRDYVDEKQISVFNPEEARKFFEKNFQNSDVITLLTTPEIADTVYINEIINGWNDIFDVIIQVEEVEISEYKRRIAEKDYQLASYQLISEYGNPYDTFELFKTDSEIPLFSDKNVNSLLEQSEKFNGTTKKCEIYAEVEKNIIDNGGFIPVYYKKTYLISTNSSENIIFNPFRRTVNFRYARNYS